MQSLRFCLETNNGRIRLSWRFYQQSQTLAFHDINIPKNIGDMIYPLQMDCRSIGN
jgi:hypothetical protein